MFYLFKLMHSEIIKKPKTNADKAAARCTYGLFDMWCDLCGPH